MISDTLPYAYIDQNRKFYTFFMNFRETQTYEVSNHEAKVAGNTEPRTRTFEGFNFFCFDQYGFCWFQAVNVTRQFLQAIGDGIFLQRPAWEVDTDAALYKPLKRDEWMPRQGETDIGYALETVWAATGLDLMMLFRGTNGVSEGVPLLKDGQGGQ